jgi:hypothetical protein
MLSDWLIVASQRRRRSPFGPSGNILPVTIVFDPLWSSSIAPVARIEFRDMQTLEVFLKSLTDERGPIQVLPLCRYVRCFQEPYIEKNCTIFIVAFMIARSSLKGGSI